MTARQSNDVSALRRSAFVIEERANPRGWWGRVVLRTLVRLLRDTADTIEREKRESDEGVRIR